jgi:hypothetical protein
LETREKVTTATIIEYASKCEAKKMWGMFLFKSYEVLVGFSSKKRNEKILREWKSK